jgi:hypothetical protein
VLVLGTTLAAIAGRAAAATITVNTTFDGTAPNQCSLREAIIDVDSPGTTSGNCAPAAFGANTIVLRSGTYSLFGPGQLAIASTVTSLTITGTSEGSTVIDASQLGNRVFEVTAGARVTVNGLTISGGHAPNGPAGLPGSAGAPGAAGGAGASGGAIFNQGTLILNDVAVTNSIAGSGGPGGPGGGTPKDAALAMGGDGGSGGAGGGIYNTGTLTLTGVTISGNRGGNGGQGGQGGQGGAGNGGAGGHGGNGGDGGGISNVGGTLTVVDSTINGNTAGPGGPGGNGNQGSATSGAGGNGGAGFSGGGVSSAGGTDSVTNTTFASNLAGAGGAGGPGGVGGTTNGDGGNGGNGGSGGGARLNSPTSALLVNVTVAANDAGAPGAPGTGAATGTPGTGGSTGGVLAAGFPTTLQNSLLFSNDGGNCSSLITDGGHNLSFAGSGCPATFASGDPDLGSLQNNGGATKTISLQPGSAAINQIPSTGAGCPATDQRGVPRPSGSACDIGAYEVAPPLAQTTAVTKVTNTDATLSALVTPNAGPTIVVFDYGTSTKYGKTVAVSGVSGVTPVAALAKIGKLEPDTTYHYRVVVATMDGSATGADRTFATTSIPALSRLKVSGSQITYHDSEAAQTTFKIVRASGRNGKTVASFSHRDRKGANTLTFKRSKLKPGKYVLQATPRFQRQSGARVSLKFTIA